MQLRVFQVGNGEYSAPTEMTALYDIYKNIVSQVHFSSGSEETGRVVLQHGPTAAGFETKRGERIFKKWQTKTSQSVRQLVRKNILNQLN